MNKNILEKNPCVKNKNVIKTMRDHIVIISTVYNLISFPYLAPFNSYLFSRIKIFLYGKAHEEIKDT